ncbi:MAG: DUF2249 domain-containing protein [Pseudonocardia sp.]|nr:DUF2249 domain-containing protein [Pseudonocardia sp.]
MTTTSAVVVASSPQDAQAVEAVEQHHAELAGSLATLTGELLTATPRPDREAFERARRAAVRFCTEELLPHAGAEEAALYPVAAASERARLLVESMRGEHAVLTRLVEELAEGSDPVRVAATGHALRVLFDVHLAKENDLVLPAVAADPTVSLAAALERMHELMDERKTGPEETEPAAAGHGACGCGESDPDVLELDVRAVPHAIRHATVFGAFDAVPRDRSLVLVAPHDPLPLLRQLGERTGGRLEVTYLERGPQAWRLQLTRT